MQVFLGVYSVCRSKAGFPLAFHPVVIWSFVMTAYGVFQVGRENRSVLRFLVDGASHESRVSAGKRPLSCVCLSLQKCWRVFVTFPWEASCHVAPCDTSSCFFSVTQGNLASFLAYVICGHFFLSCVVVVVFGIPLT